RASSLVAANDSPRGLGNTGATVAGGSMPESAPAHETRTAGRLAGATEDQQAERQDSAMATTTRDSFAAIWRPLFADRCPADAAIADAWSRTQRLLGEAYGHGLSEKRCREMVGEMAIAW